MSFSTTLITNKGEAFSSTQIRLYVYHPLDVTLSISCCSLCLIVPVHVTLLCLPTATRKKRKKESRQSFVTASVYVILLAKRKTQCIIIIQQTTTATNQQQQSICFAVCILSFCLSPQCLCL